MAARRFALLGHAHTVAGDVLETAITDGTLLARVADAETITGAWSFAPTADEKLRITDAESDGQAAVMFLSFWDQDSRQGVMGFGSSGDEKLRIRTDAATAGIYLLPGDAILDLDGVIRMQERGNALADVATYGQWWVKNDTPAVPRFTDDAGLDGILAQLNLAQTVSGAWTFSNNTTFTGDIVAGTVAADFAAITGTSYGGIAEANLVDKAATETITEPWTFTKSGGASNSGAILSAASPSIKWNESDESADNKNWYVQAFGGALLHRVANDAESVFTTYQTVHRTGTTVDSVAFATAITATSYGGITEANLLDKSSAETVSGGQWTFANTLNAQVGVRTNNGAFFNSKEAGGTTRSLLGITAADLVLVGTTVLATRIQGTSVDVQAALTATSYGGITEANLLDKAATETVTGAYDFTTGGLKVDGDNVIAGYASGKLQLKVISFSIDIGGTAGTNIDIVMRTGVGRDFNTPSLTNATNLAASGSSGSFSDDGSALRVIKIAVGDSPVSVLSAVVLTSNFDLARSAYIDAFVQTSAIKFSLFIDQGTATQELNFRIDLAAHILVVQITYLAAA